MSSRETIAAGRGASGDVDPREYERAVLERFRTLFPNPGFEVRHDIRMPGVSSGAMRQIDVAIYDGNGTGPLIVVEAKRHRRRVDLESCGATIALFRDIGEPPAIMVSAAGFSRSAERQLSWEGIDHLTVSIREARGLRWIPMIEKWFGLDRWFREASGDLLEALRIRDTAPFLETDVPYEEWVAVFMAGLAMFPDAAAALLLDLARYHTDDGARFNAVQMLIDHDQLSRAQAAQLLTAEIDPDTWTLLAEFTLEKE